MTRLQLIADGTRCTSQLKKEQRKCHIHVLYSNFFLSFFFFLVISHLLPIEDDKNKNGSKRWGWEGYK